MVDSLSVDRLLFSKPPETYPDLLLQSQTDKPYKECLGRKINTFLKEYRARK